MLKVKYITPENMYTTSTLSGSGIQSIHSGFKSIKFDHGIKRQAVEPVNEKNIIVYIADILIDQDINCLLFKNSVEYV